MKTVGLAVLIGIAVFAVAWGLGVEREYVLSGTYVSDDQDEPGPLRAVFKERGKKDDAPTWSVVFTAMFGTQEYVFTGTAEGGLRRGKLSGWVTNEAGTRTFNFRGEHKDGVYEATHAEIENFEEVPTGTLTLRR